MADKGEYRGFYVALPDSPDFQALSPEARAIFYPLKLKLGKAGIDVFYPEVLPRLTGYPFERVSEGLQELREAGWLITEHNVYWIRNGLRFDPSEPLASPNQKKGIEAHIRTLPKLAIVNEFARYYELSEPHAEVKPLANPSERVSKPLRSTEDGRRKTEEEEANASLSGSDEPNRDGPSIEDAKMVRDVFEHWRSVSGHEKATLTPERRKKIRSRLRTYSVADLKRAVEGACANPFFAGENEHGQRYDWPETIFKNDAAVEKHMAYEPGSGSPRNGAGHHGAQPVIEWSEEQIRAWSQPR